jgi:radial spoke head protein 1
MAEEEVNEEQQEQLVVSELWALAKPPAPETADDEDVESKTKKVAAPGAKIGKLIKLLNDIEEQEELETKVQELDPATGQSLLLWATLQGKFVLVEWLVKKCKRSAFAFQAGADKELAIYDKWVEIRKEIEEKEREKLLNPPEEEAAGDGEDEDKAPEPTADQLVFEALSEFHEEWGAKGAGLVKSVGELGIFQGARDQERNKNGLGQTLFPNGDMYVGQYKANRREGTGTYCWQTTGILYTGQWRNNLRCGVGRIVYPDGGRYLGSWVDDVKTGQGRYTYPDGSSYAGSWANDTKHGFGTYTFVDGSVFIGSFVDNEFVSGEWRLAGGARYYGTFVNDVPVGKGVYIYKYGQSMSFRQEGEYVKGQWQPGAIARPDDAPVLQIVVQGRGVSLRFSPECGGNTMETLVHVANFAPFLQWMDGLNAEARRTVASVSEVEVLSVKFADDSSIAQVTLRPTVCDSEGKRLRGSDCITLKASTTRLLVLLVSGEKSVVIAEQAVSATASSALQIRLPTIRAAPDGSLQGEFVRVVEPALRLTLKKPFTADLTPQLFTNPSISNTTENVIAYIQAIHPDAMASLQKRLVATNPFVQYVPVRVQDLAAQSTDATTILAALEIQSRQQRAALPAATIEAQRPPTPMPPAPEPRPNIEPLLEEEKKLTQKKTAVTEDE